MKLREIMTGQVIRVGAEEPVAVAARALTQYNIGILPVCGSDGRICGLVTDRDIVTRCIASNRTLAETTVSDVMTSRVVTAGPDTEVGDAARLMAREQIRRLPVMENGKLCGMVSLADIAGTGEAEAALRGISGSLSSR